MATDWSPNESGDAAVIESDHGIVRDDNARRVRLFAELFENDSRTSRLLADKLCEAVWNQLSLVRACLGDNADTESILQKYSLSVAELDAMHSESARFFEAVCRTNLDIRSTGLEDERFIRQVTERELSVMQEQLQVRPFPLDNVLRSAVTTQAPTALLEKVRAALSERVRFLIREFFEACRRGLENEVLGIVEWLSPSECTLVFHRRVLCELNTSHVVTEGKTITENPDADHEVYSRTDTIADTMEYKVNKARYEHKLIKANHVYIDANRVPIPAKFRAMVDAVPTWLRRQVEVVSGVQVHEQIIEIEERTERTQSVREEYRLLSEPAIVLGPIVFSGWGTLEIEEEYRRQAELSRQERMAAERVTTRKGWIARVFLLTLVSAVAVVANSATFSGYAGLPFVGVLMTFIGVCLTVDLARMDARMRANLAFFKAATWAVAAYMSVVLCLSTLGATFVAVRMWHGFAGVLGTVASVYCVWQFHNARTEPTSTSL